MTSVLDIDAGLVGLSASGGAISALPQGAGDKLMAYITLLQKWNATYNLTAIREPERMLTHHVLDALAILPHLPDVAARHGSRKMTVLRAGADTRATAAGVLGEAARVGLACRRVRHRRRL